jgi:hypothetical protein
MIGLDLRTAAIIKIGDEVHISNGGLTFCIPKLDPELDQEYWWFE